MLKLHLGLGSWMLVFGVLTLGRAEGGTVHFPWGADAPEQLANANVELYENLVATRNADPVKFDPTHHFYGRLLTHSTFANVMVQRWEANEQSFENRHPYLWRILDGIAHGHRFSTIAPANVGPPFSVQKDPPDSESSGPAGGIQNASSVPEPSTWLMMLSGLGFLGLATSRHRSPNRRPFSTRSAKEIAG